MPKIIIIIIIQQNFVYIEDILKSIKYKIIRNVIPISPSIIQDNRPNTIHTMHSNYGDEIYIKGKVSYVKVCGSTIETIQTSKSYIGCKSRLRYIQNLYK